MISNSITPRILRLKQVIHAIGLSRSSIYRLMGLEKSAFPKPIKIGITAVGWLAEDIDLWIVERKLAAKTIH